MHNRALRHSQRKPISAHCCHSNCPSAAASPRYRRVPVKLLILAVEFLAGIESVSLLADAIDFTGDVANYGASVIREARRDRNHDVLLEMPMRRA